MNIDLESELYAAARNVRQPHLDRLQALGVTPATIAELGSWQVPFGVVTASLSDDGTYQPDDTGVPLIIHPVIGAIGLVDLVGWRSGDPSRFWLRAGLGWMLNGYRCLYGGWDCGSLTLHADPLTWLRSGCIGGVVVDWDAPDLDLLRSFDAIHVTAPRLAGMIESKLRRPARLPRISFEEAQRAA